MITTQSGAAAGSTSAIPSGASVVLVTCIATSVADGGGGATIEILGGGTMVVPAGAALTPTDDEATDGEYIGDGVGVVTFGGDVAAWTVSWKS